MKGWPTPAQDVIADRDDIWDALDVIDAERRRGEAAGVAIQHWIDDKRERAGISGLRGLEFIPPEERT